MTSWMKTRDAASATLTPSLLLEVWLWQFHARHAGDDHRRMPTQMRMAVKTPHPQRSAFSSYSNESATPPTSPRRAERTAAYDT